jgi:pimeloyl-ACP methyl ester carboxylesterase
VRFIEGVAVNDAVRVHYLDAQADGADALPVVIVPGLSESAEEYTALMGRLAPRRCVAISLRGRGRSDVPTSGYTLDDHAGDLLAVVRHVNLALCVLVAFSRGVPYAIRCASSEPARIAALVLGDYPAVHRRLPENWTRRFLASSWRGRPVVERVPAAVVEAVPRESAQVPLWDELRSIGCPVLVVGGRSGGLLEGRDVGGYRRAGIADLRVAWLETGHDLLAPDERAFLGVLEGFLHDIEEAGR